MSDHWIFFCYSSFKNILMCFIHSFVYTPLSDMIHNFKCFSKFRFYSQIAWTWIPALPLTRSAARASYWPPCASVSSPVRWRKQYHGWWWLKELTRVKARLCLAHSTCSVSGSCIIQLSLYIHLGAERTLLLCGWRTESLGLLRDLPKGVPSLAVPVCLTRFALLLGALFSKLHEYRVFFVCFVLFLTFSLFISLLFNPGFLHFTICSIVA